MSAEHINHIEVPGISARVVVDADYHWWGLGELLAEGFDREQADFLLAFAEKIQALPGADGLMQLQYLADLFNSDKDWNKDDLVWLLRELLIRLEDDE